MKKPILALMAVMFFLVPVDFVFSDVRKDKVDVVEFVNTCKENCYRQFAYVYRNENIQRPDLVVFLFYKHLRGEKSTHELKDVYGLIAYSNKSFKEVWGAVLDGDNFSKTFEPFSYDFKAFFRGAKVERVGDYKGFEKKIFENVKALFGEKGERSSVLERKLT